MIGKLLGHTQAQTTARYAHLAADPMQAAEQVISNIASILYGRLLRSQDADAELALPVDIAPNIYRQPRLPGLRMPPGSSCLLIVVSRSYVSGSNAPRKS